MIADRIRLEFLDWYDERSINDLINKYSSDQWDFIFGSDIFFHKKGHYSKETIEVHPERINSSFFSLDFETILALFDRLFTSGPPSLKFLGTIERRRYLKMFLFLDNFCLMSCSRSTMLKLNHLVELWQMKMDIVPLSSFNGETIVPHLVAGHDILLISLMKNA